MKFIQSLSLMDRFLAIIFILYLVLFDWFHNGIIAIFTAVYAVIAVIVILLKGISRASKEKED